MRYDERPKERMSHFSIWCGRDETVPLEKIVKIEHPWFSRQVEYDSRATRPCQPRASSERRFGQVGDEPRVRQVETATNCGHNPASLHDIPVMSTLLFEDFKPGPLGRFGPRRVTREEILDFAAEFDPQPMHLNEEAALRSMLKGLSGSGWHLCSIIMRMMFDGFIGRTASFGSPGVNQLRWLAPLRPDDELVLDVEVMEARISRSRPATGIVMFKAVVSNAAGQALCEMTSPIIVQRRAAIASGQA
jgi:acyl dehydratase